MDTWVHRCPWCDWSRAGESPTMLEPRCSACGGLLEAVPAGAVAREVGSLRASFPVVSPAFGRLLRLALFALLLFAAARFGANAGGPGLAVAGAGVVGLFTVPLIVGG